MPLLPFSRREELEKIVADVGGWWNRCEGLSQWLGETESDMTTHKPLASSLDIIEKQKNSVQVIGRRYSTLSWFEKVSSLQALVNGVESHQENYEETLKALERLATHKQLLEPAPIETYKTALDRRWKALGKEVCVVDAYGHVTSSCDGHVISSCDGHVTSSYDVHIICFTLLVD